MTKEWPDEVEDKIAFASLEQSFNEAFDEYECLSIAVQARFEELEELIIEKENHRKLLNELRARKANYKKEKGL